MGSQYTEGLRRLSVPCVWLQGMLLVHNGGQDAAAALEAHGCCEALRQARREWTYGCGPHPLLGTGPGGGRGGLLSGAAAPGAGVVDPQPGCTRRGGALGAGPQPHTTGTHGWR